MSDRLLLEDIARVGKPPASALADILDDARVRVLAFGESHAALNPHRRFGRDVMGELGAHGFRFLALELPEPFQVALDRFNRGILNAPELAEELEFAGASLFVGGDRGEALPCEYYFGMLSVARDAGMWLYAIDKDRGENDSVWYSRQFADRARDESMAARILELWLSAGGGARVAYWGGAGHLYKRPPELRGRWRTVAETTCDYLHASGELMFCLAGAMNVRVPPAAEALSFAPLYPWLAGIDAPLCVFPADSSVLGDFVVGSDRRCPWGSCIQKGNPTEICPGVDFGLCPGEPATEVRLAFWDALVLYPSP